MDTFEGAVVFVDGAAGPEDVFGVWESAAPKEQAAATLRRAAGTYRRLARVLHPDRAPAGREPDARRAFAVLATLWERYQRLACHGHKSAVSGTTMVSGKHIYRIGELVERTEIANVYTVEYGDDASAAHGLLKLPRDPRDSDLMRREAEALAAVQRDGDRRFRAFAPELVDTFRHRDPTDGTRRQGVVTAGTLAGFHTLAQVRACYLNAVDPRDAAWMWRRLLVALDYAHRARVVHGAVLPGNVRIHARQHGLVLVDWCYSASRPGDRIPAIAEEYRAWYPPEVTSHRAPGPATDIHLATRCMEYLIGQDAMPRALANFARGCTLASERLRPQDARRLLAELDDILERLYGRRTFRPFAMPPAASRPNA
jgi:hypothetical protein